MEYTKNNLVYMLLISPSGDSIILIFRDEESVLPSLHG